MTSTPKRRLSLTPKPATPVCFDANDGWTPRRDGDAYCSSRCGFRCTWAAYQKAIEGANALCKMLGEGWKPVVWENCGWHYKAERGVASVQHHYIGKDFTCFFDSNVKQLVVSSPDPRQAVQDAVSEATALARQLLRDATRSGSELTQVCAALQEPSHEG